MKQFITEQSKKRENEQDRLFSSNIFGSRKPIWELDYNEGSIIEGDQNQVAVFSLEHFSNSTRSAWAHENARN